jgi:hypothetical protein
MIKIHSSSAREKINEMADISGSWKDFEILRQDILKFLESNKESIFIGADKSMNSDGWDFVLEGLEINQEGDSVRVSVVENKFLKIQGSKIKLEIFAAWLEFSEDIESGYHSHYEYFEGNEYVDSKSIPLVIRIK